MGLKKENQTLSFKPRARLIRTIGDRLITGPETAVIELVKNSYDADANYARVVIEPTSSDHEGRIIIEDDGHGMSLNDIEYSWMEPATTYKVKRRKSPNGRLLLGSKGIGRFAVARLGHMLEMVSTARNPDDSGAFQTIRIPEINWEVFDHVKYLSDVKFNYEVIASGVKTGTRLVVTDLREKWTEARLTELHREMRRLILPLKKTEKADFKIYLDLSTFLKTNAGFDGAEIVNGLMVGLDEDGDPHRIKPYPLLNSCDYEISGEFSEEGFFSGFFTIHRGGLEPEKIELSFPLEEGEANCGLVLVQLFIFDREMEALKNAMRRAGEGNISVKQARALVDSIAGVAIYRDKFRIRPYGDSDNDWLTLDTRRVQNPSMRIGHNQVSGILVISGDKDSGLIEKSSREGLEENDNYRRIQRLINALFPKVIEPKRYTFRNRAKIERNESNVLSKAIISAEFKWAETILSSLPDLPDEIRNEAQGKIEKESRALLRYLKQLEGDQAKLGAQVTLGLIVGEVLHEGRGAVAYIFDQARRLSRWWPGILERTKEAEKNALEVPGILRGISINSKKLRDLFRALKPLAGGKRGKPTYYNPNQAIIDSFILFRGKLKEGNVEDSHTDKTGGKDILGYREDLSTAVTNIVDNSLFWLEHHEIKEPKIFATVDAVGSDCVILISDNGPGIPYEFRESIFDVGFSLKPMGTGLGMSIAQEAIARSKGVITLVDTGQGTSFSIKIPYEA